MSTLFGSFRAKIKPALWGLMKRRNLANRVPRVRYRAPQLATRQHDDKINPYYASAVNVYGYAIMKRVALPGKARLDCRFVFRLTITYSHQPTPAPVPSGTDASLAMTMGESDLPYL